MPVSQRIDRARSVSKLAKSSQNSQRAAMCSLEIEGFVRPGSINRSMKDCGTTIWLSSLMAPYCGSETATRAIQDRSKPSPLQPKQHLEDGFDVLDVCHRQALLTLGKLAALVARFRRATAPVRRRAWWRTDGCPRPRSLPSRDAATTEINGGPHSPQIHGIVEDHRRACCPNPHGRCTGTPRGCKVGHYRSCP